MQRFSPTIATALVAALLGSAAFTVHAQPQTPAVNAVQSAKASRAPNIDFAQRHAHRMEQLKTVLQLQPAQQAAWDKFANAMTPQPRAKPKGKRGADMRQLTTPERLDLAQKLRKERTAQAEQREAALRSFYTSLTPSQQKAFDTVHAQHYAKQKMHKAGRDQHRHERRAPQRGDGPMYPSQGNPAVMAPSA